jgi:hypothetical protein
MISREIEAVDNIGDGLDYSGKNISTSFAAQLGHELEKSELQSRIPRPSVFLIPDFRGKTDLWRSAPETNRAPLHTPRGGDGSGPPRPRLEKKPERYSNRIRTVRGIRKSGLPSYGTNQRDLTPRRRHPSLKKVRSKRSWCLGSTPSPPPSGSSPQSSLVETFCTCPRYISPPLIA